MTQNNVDLAGIFGAVTQALSQNQQSLNQADEYNQDHGTNMVQTFQTITNALRQKQGSSHGAALKYAASQLSKSSTSGSGQVYAQNLSQAASQFKGKNVDAQGALQLLQTLIGGGQAGQAGAQSASGDALGALLGGGQSGGGDMLGGLLGGLMGGGSGQSSQPAGGDMLGSLLGGLMGGGGGQASQSGDMLGNLLGGLAGGGGLSALAGVFLGGSGMGNASHRNQSTQVVVNTFLQALGALGGAAR